MAGIKFVTGRNFFRAAEGERSATRLKPSGQHRGAHHGRRRLEHIHDLCIGAQRVMVKQHKMFHLPAEGSPDRRRKAAVPPAGFRGILHRRVLGIMTRISRSGSNAVTRPSKKRGTFIQCLNPVAEACKRTPHGIGYRNAVIDNQNLFHARLLLLQPQVIGNRTGRCRKLHGRIDKSGTRCDFILRRKGVLEKHLLKIRKFQLMRR